MIQVKCLAPFSLGMAQPHTTAVLSLQFCATCLSHDPGIKTLNRCYTSRMICVVALSKVLVCVCACLHTHMREWEYVCVCVRMCVCVAWHWEASAHCIVMVGFTAVNFIHFHSKNRSGLNYWKIYSHYSTCHRIIGKNIWFWLWLHLHCIASTEFTTALI